MTGGKRGGLQYILSRTPSLGSCLWHKLGYPFSGPSTCSVANAADSPAQGKVHRAHLVLTPVVRKEMGGSGPERRGSISMRGSLVQQAGGCQVLTQLTRSPLKPGTQPVVPLGDFLFFSHVLGAPAILSTCKHAGRGMFLHPRNLDCFG